MALSQSAFKRAQGRFADLEVVQRNRYGIAAVAASLEGARGGGGPERAMAQWYRVVVDTRTLTGNIPMIWFAAPPDSSICHVNIWPAKHSEQLAAHLPWICWGGNASIWDDCESGTGTRSLYAVLVTLRSVLRCQNFDSPARSCSRPTVRPLPGIKGYFEQVNYVVQKY